MYPKFLAGLLAWFFRETSEKRSSTGALALLGAALSIIVLALYWQVGSHQFLNLDDNVYLTANPHVVGGLTGDNLIWAFTSVDATNWHPVTWLSHLTDVELYGMEPRGHHLTSVVIHILSSLLLLLLLFRCTASLWQSAFVAALFALHPLHVESVAWVAERKDVLSALFGFLTLYLYAAYVAKPKPATYLLTFFCFAVGLMCKPMLVTLPMVMLLLDFWPLQRFRIPQHEPGGVQLPGKLAISLREKVPFFLLSLFSGLITFYAQDKGEAVATLRLVPFGLRVENALLAYLKYLGKLFWPRDLAVFYPFPASVPLWQAIGALLVLFLITTAVLRLRRRFPYLAVGWFWYLVTLVPVIGLIQVGAQSMADRYSYIPSIGIFIMVAWGAADLSKGLARREGMLALLAGAVLLACAVLTWQQLGYWADNFSLYRHTLQVSGAAELIHNNLGSALASEGNLDAAIQEYREALRISPDYMEAHYNLAMALGTKGDAAAAISEYREAHRLSPANTKILINLGSTLAGIGNLDAAELEYGKVLQISPDSMEAHYCLGLAHAGKGEFDLAIREFQEALRINPNFADAANNLARVSALKGKQN